MSTHMKKSFTKYIAVDEKIKEEEEAEEQNSLGFNM